MSEHGHGLCAEGDDVVHIGAVAFGHFFEVRGCATSPHLAIRIDDAGDELEGKPEDIQQEMLSRGWTLVKLGTGTESVEETTHHNRPEVRLRREALGAAICTDPECDLSGGNAHVGACEPCGCELRHAVDECPDREEGYETFYRLLVGVNGAMLHMVKTQLARVEELHPGCEWTISPNGWAVAWLGGDPVAFVAGCVDKEASRTKPISEALAARYAPCGRPHGDGMRHPHDHAVAEVGSVPA